MRVSGLAAALETFSQVGLSHASMDSYYPGEEEPSQADPEVASRGVGEIGDVKVAPSLWKVGCHGDFVNGTRSGEKFRNP